MNIMFLPIDKSEVGTCTVMEKPDGAPLEPFGSWGGDINALCGGQCGFTLFAGMHSANQLQNLIFICPQCGTYNLTRT